MIEYEGKKFYTSYEIYNLLSPEYTDVINTLWKNTYNRYCRGEVQGVLDKARKCKVLKFLKYTTQPNGGKLRYAYSLEDVCDFLEKKIPLRDLVITSGVYNVEYK